MNCTQVISNYNGALHKIDTLPVVVVVFELVREKNVDQAKFRMLVKKNCPEHLDKDVDK